MAAARRVTIDLTEDMSLEIERIRDATGLSIADIFRHSFTLLRIYLEAKDKNEEMRIVSPQKPRDQVRIELPTVARKSSVKAPKKVSATTNTK